MPELTDDQLDGLFRKSAEEFDPPFDPAAWRDMKTQLDANDRNPSGGSLIWKNLLRWGLPLVLLLLVSGGGWYAYRRVHPAVVNVRSRVVPTVGGTLSQKSKQTRSGLMSPASDHESARTTTVGPKESEAHAAKQPTDLVASVADPARLGKRLDKSVTDSENKVTPNPEAATKRSALTYRPETERTRLNDLRPAKPVDAGSKSVLKTTHSWKGSTVSRIAGATKRQRKSDVIRFGETSTSTNYATGSARRSNRRKRSADYNLVETPANGKAVDISGNLPLSGGPENDRTSFPALSELATRPAKWPKPLSFTGREVVSQPDTTSRKVVANRDSERGLSIRAVVAPDLSSIGLKNFSRPGTNVGLLLEYRLANRWSVQAGVIQSTKIYRALPSEYNPPAGAWNGGGRPENIDGLCNMLDIPINVRYDIILKPQSANRLASRWFVSGGVTSYIMEREDYDYNFAAHTYPYPKTYGVDTTTGGYRFSNLNLSIGYERAFSQRLSWQVEPFVKVPLKGVGLFNINLLSTGVFFSLRYKLSK